MSATVVIHPGLIGLALMSAAGSAEADGAPVFEFRAATAEAVLDEVRRLQPILQNHLPRFLAQSTPPPGIEAKAPAELRFVSGGIALLGLHVADGEAVDRWLQVQSEEPEAGIFLVWAHAPETLCARAEAHLWCQIGVAEDGVRPLRKAIQTEPQPPDEGRWSIRTEGEALSRWLLQWELHEARRHMRFESPERRRGRLRRAVRRAAHAQEWAEMMEQARLTRTADALRLELELSAAGAQWLTEATAPTDPRLSGWTSGPALLSAFSRLRFAALFDWVEPLRPEGTGPIEADGPFALAAFGFDPYHWHQDLGLPQRMGVLLSGAVAVRSASTSTSSLHVRGRFRGAPLEAMRRDGLLVVGLGHGAGPAAVRRLHRCRPAEVPEDLLTHARLDLQAVKAALEAIPETALGQPGLAWLQRLQSVVRAWPRSVRSLELELRRPRERLLQANLRMLHSPSLSGSPATPTPPPHRP